MKNNYKKFCERLQEIIDWQVEYETSHDDAGSNYDHCVIDNYEYQGGDKRFAEWLEDQEIRLQGITVEDLAQHLFNFDIYRMVEGSIFGPYGVNEETAFTVASFAVGEVEIQIELSTLEEEFGTFARGMWLKACNDRQFCLRGDMSGKYPSGLAYECTDAVWFAVFDKETVIDSITDLVESKEFEATI